MARPLRDRADEPPRPGQREERGLREAAEPASLRHGERSVADSLESAPNDILLNVGRKAAKLQAGYLEKEGSRKRERRKRMLEG